MERILHHHHIYGLAASPRRTVILLLLLNVTRGYSQLNWTETPGRVQVLNNTNATFRWSFRGSQQVAIEWTYLGTPQRRDNDVILLRKEARDIHYGVKGPRSHYSPYNGSATLILTNASFSDLGEYETKVMDIETAKYITDIASLRIFSGATYNISVDNRTYVLTLDENGTSVTLPGEEYTLSPSADIKRPSHTSNITTQVSDTAPKPVVQVTKLVAGNTAYTSICTGYYCNRLVSFDQNDAEFSEGGDDLRGQVVISIDFNLQNIPLVNVSMNVNFFTDETTSRRVDNVVIAAIFGALIIPCFVFAIVVLIRKQYVLPTPTEAAPEVVYLAPSSEIETTLSANISPHEDVGPSSRPDTDGPKMFRTKDFTDAISPAFQSLTDRLSTIERHLGVTQEKQIHFERRRHSVGSDSTISYKDAVSRQPTPNPGRGDGGNRMRAGHVTTLLEEDKV